MKKIISSLLACLLILGLVPIGLVSLNMPASAEGEVLKIAPVIDTFVQAGSNADKTGQSLESRVGSEKANLTGRGNETYFQFSLDGILGKEVEDIVMVKLRFAVIAGGEGATLTLSQLQNNDWNGSITQNKKPSGALTELAVFHPSSGKNIVEIDLTNSVKQWLEDGQERVSFVLKGKTSDRNPVRIASTRNTDPTYRPYLKVIMGDAEDPDPSSLEKATLEQSLYVSSNRADTAASELSAQSGSELKAGNGHELYLRFKLYPDRIQGAIDRALFNLNATTDGGSFTVSYLDHNGWSDSMTYQTRPQGAETPLYSSGSGWLDHFDGIDLTDLVSDLYEQGKDTLTLHITGGEQPVSFIPGYVPKLELLCTDDQNMIAIRKAAANLLGLNSTASSITSDLLGTYAADGTPATVTWAAYDTTINEENGAYLTDQYIASDGVITRPLWFEGTKTFEATAEIKAGDKQVTRKLTLTLPPEKEPNYTGYVFDNYLDIGNTEDEVNQKFEAVQGSGVLTRHVDGETFTYRTLGPDGSMVLNMKCSPSETNYLTIKLWGGDATPGTLFISDPATGNMNADNTRQPVIDPSDAGDFGALNVSSGKPEQNGGFIYATYQIPEIYTQDRDFVSLRLYSRGEKQSDGVSSLAEQTSESRGLYAAYLTQSPNLDPSAFETEGEIITEKPIPTPVPKYDTSDAGDMAKTKNQMLSYVKSAVSAFQDWQIYGAANYPPYMEGSIARDTSWQRKALTDTDWKDAYYDANTFLRQNLAPLSGLEVYAYAYQYAPQLGFSAENQEEFLDRLVKGIDFLCRAQGSNGGFYSQDGWIGGPERNPADNTAKTAGGLSAAGKALLMMYDDIEAAGYLSQLIDADADGVKETNRQEAWSSMLTSARDYIAAATDGQELDQVTYLNTLTSRLRFDQCLHLLGSTAAYPAETVRGLLDSAFGQVTAKGLLTYAAAEYPDDYCGVDLSAAADLVEIAVTGYFKNDPAAQTYYHGLMKRLYEGAEQYYLNTSAVQPPDLYSAVKLNNPVALKVIENHLIYGTNDTGKPEFNTASPLYEWAVTEMLPLCFQMDQVLARISEMDISDRLYPLEDESKDGYAWTDEAARRVVIKNGYDRIYLTLNSNSSAKTQDGTIKLKASDRFQFHRMTPTYEQYGDGQMFTQGFEDWTESPDGNIDTLMYASYGEYNVVMNADQSNEYYIPKEKLQLSGVYKDLVSGNYYTFLKSGEKIDDSVIPSGAELMDGRNIKLQPNTTIVLYHLAIPVTSSDWKVSEINQTSVSNFTVTDGTEISSVTIKKVGDALVTDQELTVMCSVYDGKKLTGFASETIHVTSDTSEYVIDLSGYGLTADKGQKLKFFVLDDMSIPLENAIKKEIKG